MKLTKSKIIFLQKKISHCLSIDRYKLTQELLKINHNANKGLSIDVQLKHFVKKLESSCDQTSARLLSAPIIKYQEDLPIAKRRDEIKKAISDNQVVIIAGETGSGKTTQLPKICLELGRGSSGIIGHTQPRRIAARTVANRIAEELNQPLGQAVGYQVRFNEKSGPNTLIKLMTDGILLAEVQHDRYFSKYDTIIIDEAHERSLNIDFLLGYLKTILPKRPDLKLIVTSATIDLEKFSQHFDSAPVIEVSGRTYPVEVQYIQPEEGRDLGNSILDAVEHIFSLPERGDILIFHSGEREIRETAKILRKAALRHVDIVPLYARLSLKEQIKVFSPHKGTRIVLSTNVAETSLTVPGIRYVIDPGMARISRYSYRTKVQRLPIEPISQASANQRKGRCGRVGNGTCFRLYSEDDFNSRSVFTDSEIIRTNLASVILKMLYMKIGDIREFSFLESPDNRLINDGYNLLHELQAVTKKLELTDIGKKLSRIPTDPKLGRMLLAAEKEGSLKEVLIIVSALGVQDPRDRPSEYQADADLKHRQWQDRESDFSTLINLWRHFEKERQDLSRSQFEKYCRKNYISAMRMREWRELHHQLHKVCRDIGIKENHKLADYESIHRAVLSGLLGQIGCQRIVSDQSHPEKKQKKSYKEFSGARNRIFYIFPGSPLSKLPPPWLMAAEMIETSKLFSHHNARIEPEWLSIAAVHLTKKTYSEPHYSARNGQVMAYEKQALYGLLIVDKKRLPYSKINPVVSREIFIRSALVEGEYRGGGDFFDYNIELKKNLLNVESKTRRRNILVDDSVIFNFYNSLIPENINSLSVFESWRKKKELEYGASHFLYLSENLLRQEGCESPDVSDFPDYISWEGIAYSISYRFEPGQAKDGITVTLPVSTLHQLPAHLFEWLVPGMLRDKCISLIKSLPKIVRRNFVPVPDYVDKFLELATPQDIKLTEALSIALKSLTGFEIDSDDWNEECLESIFYINFELIDKFSYVLATSKSLEELKSQFKEKISDTLAQSTTSSIEKKDIKDWSFGDLPKIYPIISAGLTIKTYPALVVECEKINLRLIDNELVAANKTILGLIALYQSIDSTSVKYLKKNLLVGMDLQLKFSGFTGKSKLVKQIIDKAYFLTFLDKNIIPRNESKFRDLYVKEKSKVVLVANEINLLVVSLIPMISEINDVLKKLAPLHKKTMQDITRQLNFLFKSEFIFETPKKILDQYDRYLNSILIRIEKLSKNTQKQEDKILELQLLENRITQIDLKMEQLSVSDTSEIWEHYFMIQEYRVSIFSQILRTVIPISRKRIDIHWKKIQNLS